MALVAKIPLSNCDGHALVDADIVEAVSCYTWRLKYTGRKFYVATSIRKGRKVLTLYLHRLVMGEIPGLDIDHDDHDVTNCTRANLDPQHRWSHRTKHVISGVQATPEGVH